METRHNTIKLAQQWKQDNTIKLAQHSGNCDKHTTKTRQHNSISTTQRKNNTRQNRKQDTTQLN